MTETGPTSRPRTEADIAAIDAGLLPETHDFDAERELGSRPGLARAGAGPTGGPRPASSGGAGRASWAWGTRVGSSTRRWARCRSLICSSAATSVGDRVVAQRSSRVGAVKAGVARAPEAALRVARTPGRVDQVVVPPRPVRHVPPTT